MLLQRKVFDGVDANFASSKLFFLRNRGDPAVQVAFDILTFTTKFLLTAQTTERASFEQNESQARALKALR